MFAIKDPFYEPPEIDFANQEILVEEREVIPRDFKSHANKAYVKFVARDYWNQRLNVLQQSTKRWPQELKSSNHQSSLLKIWRITWPNSLMPCMISAQSGT